MPATLTETVIRRQFPYWDAALLHELPLVQASTVVLTGCGTSYYLAQVIACAFNANGQAAIAVPGAEWARRPECYLAQTEGVLVIGLSRSGTTSETVQAIRESRARGWRTLAVSCEPESTLLHAADTALYLPTDPSEGIVMSVSASLMLLAGLRMAGVSLNQTIPAVAAAAMASLETGIVGLLNGRSHFVYLGAGPNYGLATEGCLKLQEMSLSYSQAFHPMEYRHGPVSLMDDKSLVVMLYSAATATEEAALVAELQAKAAAVIGFNGPGDVRIDLGLSDAESALACLPALQMLGEMVAVSKGINSEAPRHLSKVVVLG
ncbi:MAG: SIS domain-containing protein [Cypionkella sp.]|uniref:SIS domain-containing protein n=1 Tax=Cypionkella sp. TaxID=2811411 RepID=UPI002ABB6BF3|nr:SIS domain-containing protein [Cypionkella sp.]MDZ4309589.1 SIS domain-containing protein [Cypionkella sp.]MDZ4395569.1 SIS domain-containing protein [Cypionkella sp.]